MKGLKCEAAEEGDLAFVSTNDVLVSWFCQQHSGADLAYINVDCRGRLDGITTLHAGNYQYPVVYTTKSNACTPTLIRHSLMNKSSIQRVSKAPLPTYWQCLVSVNHSMTTNKASFSKLTDITGCCQELHMPLYDPSGFIPYNFHEMIILQPHEGRIAVRVAGHNLPKTLQKPAFASDDVS